MKLTGFLISITLILSSCQKDSKNYYLLSKIDGLSFYWDHEVFGEEGRRVRFEFYGTKPFENTYDLKFEYSINEKNILIQLTDVIDKGKYINIDPGFGGGDLCAPSGRTYIPDTLLPIGKYTLTVKTLNFVTTADLIVNDDSIHLIIPPDQPLSTKINTIYPIPRNILFGAVVYSGEENTKSATDFVSNLLALGLPKIKLPNFPYSHLSVDESGNALNSSWQPNNYSLGLLFGINRNIRDIVDVARDNFNKANINIYLFSSNGDQASLSKDAGIHFIYMK